VVQIDGLDSIAPTSVCNVVDTHSRFTVSSLPRRWIAEAGGFRFDYSQFPCVVTIVSFRFPA
jgi:hypothetical protein